VAAVRFHLDESVDLRVVARLRQRAIDVTTTSDANLMGKEDVDQLAYGRQEGRVVVCFDNDFLGLHAEGVLHAGICYCHQGKYTVDQLRQALELVHGCYTAEEMANNLEWL